MKTPYDILDVTHDATDSDIKQAYLQQVKRYPPEREQEKFQQIHAAFNAIKDKKSRLSYELFNYTEVNFDELLETAFHTESPVLIGTDIFDKLLQSSINDKTFLISVPDIQKP